MDANKVFSFFHKSLFNAYNKYFPVICKRQKSRASPSWVTPDLKYCLKKKFKLLKMFKCNKITRASFLNYKNLLNEFIRQAKIIFYMKKSIAANNDAKETWKFINEILNKNKRDKVSTVNNSDGTPLTGNIMVNYFNDYFVNIVSPIIFHTPQRPLHTTMENFPSIYNTFYFFPLSSSEIQTIILKFKDKPCSISRVYLA